MFDPDPKIIVGLEIGTSKVCAVVGELNDSETVNIIGIGQAKSRGVRKGEIMDPGAASEDVRNAIAEAEQMADVMIRSVYLGVTGSHIRGLTNRGMHPVASADREITPQDVEDVNKNAKAINLPPENYVLHAIRQHYLVDGQDHISDPVGMFGSRIEVDMHVIHGHFNRLQNPIRIVRGLQIEVEAIVFNGLASALAVLTPEQKELGTLVLDLGAGVTEYVLYAGGVVKHAGVLAVGGDHVSNDLAYGLKMALGRAEALKLAHGAALVAEEDRGQMVTPVADSAVAATPVNLEHLRRIMALRLEETFDLIIRELDREGFLEFVRSGVVICGGGARIPGIQRLAEEIFQMKASLGRNNCVNGLVSTLDQPEFAAGIGLVKFGSFQQKGKQNSGTAFSRVLKKTFGDLWRKS